MGVLPTSYSDFQRLINVQWDATNWPYCNPRWSSADWCDGYCLGCDKVPATVESWSFEFIFSTIITLDRSIFQSADSLTFVFKYWPVFCSNTTAAGTNFRIYSKIGNASTIPHVFAAVDFSQWYYGTHEWNPATKFSGNISIPASFDDNGLIHVDFTIGFERGFYNPPVREHLFYAIKGISFKTLADEAAETPLPSPAPPPTSAPAGVIAGATVGGVAFIALVLASFLFYRRRKHHHVLASEKVPDEPPYSIPSSPSGRQDPVPSEPLTAVAFGINTDSAVVPPPTTVPLKATPNTQLEKEGQRPLRSPGNISTDRNIHPIPNASSTTGDIPSDPPPVYGNSTVLGTWASANRTAISEDMEAKLLAAGYMPGDNPDIFSEDEWQTRYGLTRLELFRLRRLYAGAADTGALGQ